MFITKVEFDIWNHLRRAEILNMKRIRRGMFTTAFIKNNWSAFVHLLPLTKRAKLNRKISLEKIQTTFCNSTAFSCITVTTPKNKILFQTLIFQSEINPK